MDILYTAQMGWMHGGYGSGFGGFGMGPFGFIFMFLFLSALIWSVYAVTQFFIPSKVHNDSAVEILKRRYALGEIDHKEFTRMKGEIH
jgi:uncharacterized membrane protein